MAATKHHLAGRELVSAAFALLRHDRTMVALVFLGGLAAALAFALIAVPLVIVAETAVPTTDNISLYVAYALALFVATFVWQLVLGALFAAATMRAEGGDPTIGSALAAAWARRGPLLAWALVSTLVGLAMLALERLGVAGMIVRVLAGVGWAVATLFAVPILMTEGSGPWPTIQQSSRLMVEKFGTNVRSTVRLGFTFGLLMLATVALTVGAGYVAATAWDGEVNATVIIASVFAVIGAVAFVALATLYSALGMYLRTVLYRYATGRPTPGIDASVLPAFTGTAA